MMLMPSSVATEATNYDFACLAAQTKASMRLLASSAHNEVWE